MRTLVLTSLWVLVSASQVEAAPKTLRVLGFSIEGNRAVPTAALTRVLAIRKGQRIPAVVAEDGLRAQFLEAAIVEPISRLYYQRGFVAHRLTLESVQLVRTHKGLLVRVKLFEGPRFKMGTLRRDTRRYGRSLGLQRGRTFDGEQLARGIDRIARRLRDRGYAAAEVTPKLTLDPKQKIIHVGLKVDRGAVFAVEKIELRGNLRVHGRLIRGALTFSEGERYSEGALKRSWQRLMATGLFKSVELSLSVGEEERGLVITIVSTERADCPSLDAA